MRGKKAVTAIIFCIALVTMFILSGCGGGQQSAEVASSQTESVPVSVEFIPAQKGNIQSEYAYSGKVKPAEEISVVGKVAGKVTMLNHDVGDKVLKDEVLLQIDTVDIQNNINVLQAQLAAVDAGIKSAKTGLELVNGATMQTQVASAKSALAQAELAYSDMQTTYQNNKILFESGVISKSDMDKTETGLKNAELAYNQAKLSYDLLTSKVPAENTRKAQDALNSAQANRKSVETQITNAKKSLEDAAIKSPITGTISVCNAVEGAMLSQSAGPAFVIINTDTVTVNVGVSEQLINGLAVGQEVKVKVSAASDKHQQGKISLVSPAAGQTGTYDVKIELDNKDGLLKPGMFGEVSFAKEKKDSVIVLPRNAVMTSGEDNYVFVEENGSVKKVSVGLGIDTGDRIEIIGGLQEGMNIIIKGQNYLSDGDKVNASPSSDTEKGE